MCITGPCGGTKKCCFKIKSEKKKIQKKKKKIETYLPVN